MNPTVLTVPSYESIIGQQTGNQSRQRKTLNSNHLFPLKNWPCVTFGLWLTAWINTSTYIYIYIYIYKCILVICIHIHIYIYSHSISVCTHKRTHIHIYIYMYIYIYFSVCVCVCVCVGGTRMCIYTWGYSTHKI